MEDIKYDLDAITEYFEEDLEEGDSFENYRKNIITTDFIHCNSFPCILMPFFSKELKAKCLNQGGWEGK